MAISGHRTRSTFERFNSTSERDVKLENYIVERRKSEQESIPNVALSQANGDEP